MLSHEELPPRLRAFIRLKHKRDSYRPEKDLRKVLKLYLKWLRGSSINELLPDVIIKPLEGFHTFTHRWPTHIFIKRRGWRKDFVPDQKIQILSNYRMYKFMQSSQFHHQTIVKWFKHLNLSIKDTLVLLARTYER